MHNNDEQYQNFRSAPKYENVRTYTIILIRVFSQVWGRVLGVVVNIITLNSTGEAAAVPDARFHYLQVPAVGCVL
jgi:hypothetical protein